MPSHSHGISGNSSTNGNYALATLAGNGSYTVYSYTSKATGGSQPHNNMPPYKSVYIWERTA